MRKTTMWYCGIILLFMSIEMMQGCENQRKTLVAAHNTVGTLLMATIEEAQTLHNQKVINDATYNQIKTNWIRAQTSFVNASILLETLLDKKSNDISEYISLITQVNTILSDITTWIKEGK